MRPGGGRGKKLAVAVTIWLTAPGDDRTCEDCIKFAYEAGGKLRRKPANDPKGVPQLRQANHLPPCGECKKIPPGADPHWSNAVHPSDRSRRCMAHYRECRAVGWQVPDAADPLVRQHAAMIRAVEDAVEKGRETMQTRVMLGMIDRKKEKSVG